MPLSQWLLLLRQEIEGPDGGRVYWICSSFLHTRLWAKHFIELRFSKTSLGWNHCHSYFIAKETSPERLCSLPSHTAPSDTAWIHTQACLIPSLCSRFQPWITQPLPVGWPFCPVPPSVLWGPPWPAAATSGLGAWILVVFQASWRKGSKNHRLLWPHSFGTRDLWDVATHLELIELNLETSSRVPTKGAIPY